MAYAINYTDGSPSQEYDTYAQAKAAVRAEFGPDAVIGHDGDLDSFGDRTLVWSTESDSHNDDGARAVCSIWPVDAEVV